MNVARRFVLLHGVRFAASSYIILASQVRRQLLYQCVVLKALCIVHGVEKRP